MVDSKKQNVAENEKLVAATETTSKATAAAKTTKKRAVRAKKGQKKAAVPSFASCRVWPD